MPRSKSRSRKSGTKTPVRTARPEPRSVRELRQTRGDLSRGRPKGGRPPRFPGRTGGR